MLRQTATLSYIGGEFALPTAEDVARAGVSTSRSSSSRYCVGSENGPDLSRSAAGRAAGEAVWVPSSLLPRFGVEWSAVDPHHVTASYAHHATQLDIGYTLDDDARVLAVVLDRWDDPRNEGRGHTIPSGSR